MEPLTNPHWEALTSDTLKAFYQTAKIPFVSKFYLAGGTGLALHIGHRYSIDLDFFSPEINAVGPEQRDTLRILLNDPTLAVNIDANGTFYVNWHNVGISFFRLELYPLVETPLILEGVPVATVPEIGAMKLAAIIARGVRKDYVDLYYILQRVSLESIFQVAAIKYAKVHSFPVTSTRALAYFTDAEASPMPRMLDQSSWAKMKKFLEQQALEVGRKRLHELWDNPH